MSVCCHVKNLIKRCLLGSWHRRSGGCGATPTSDASSNRSLPRVPRWRGITASTRTCLYLAPAASARLARLVSRAGHGAAVAGSHRSGGGERGSRAPVPAGETEIELPGEVQVRLRGPVDRAARADVMSVLGEKGVPTTFLREPCAVVREGGGEAVAAAEGDRLQTSFDVIGVHRHVGVPGQCREPPTSCDVQSSPCPSGEALGGTKRRGQIRAGLGQDGAAAETWLIPGMFSSSRRRSS